MMLSRCRLTANAEKAMRLVGRLARDFPREHEPCPIGSDRALDDALITAPKARDQELLKKLDAVAGRVIVLALLAPAIAAAQAPRAGSVAPPQLSNLAQGILNDNQDQPIQIDAATLEVRDKEKMATFAGDVQVVQGDTTIKCQKVVVFYGPEPGAAANASQAKRQQQQPQQSQQPLPQQQQAQARQPQQQQAGNVTGKVARSCPCGDLAQ
jgi:hypothetical protein